MKSLSKSTNRPLRVAVIGAGPAGFYATESLLKQTDVVFEVDLFDKLPTPYGLVRNGVAPDHQNIKSITKLFEKIASMPRFRFFGNIDFANHIFLHELKMYYEQILFAVGCPADRRLNIPGENLAGCHAAALVGWYNAHPEFSGEKFDLSLVRKVAIIGMGNVAMDLARVLLQSPEKLSRSDIADKALSSLMQSNIQEVTIIGRRGPAQSMFSLNEMEELSKLESVDLIFEDPDIKAADTLNHSIIHDSAVKNMAFMQDYNRTHPFGGKKKIHFRFLLSPVEIYGENGRVKSLKLEKNYLFKNASGTFEAKGTHEFETLDVDLVFRSIGYSAVPMVDVPFNYEKGIILNKNGKVINEAGEHLHGVYVTGWAKRGPSGLLGVNRSDAIEVSQLMISDAKNRGNEILNQMTSKDVQDWIHRKQPNYVTFDDWLWHDKIELFQGQRKGKIRDKLNLTICRSQA